MLLEEFREKNIYKNADFVVLYDSENYKIDMTGKEIEDFDDFEVEDYFLAENILEIYLAEAED